MLRKYSEVVEDESTVASVQEKKSSNSGLSGSLLFSSTFKNNLTKYQKSADAVYSEKIRGVSNQQILAKCSKIYNSAKNVFMMIGEFVNEISESEYSDDVVSFKITKGASVYLGFARVGDKVESFSFVKQSSDVKSISDLFSQIESSFDKCTEFSCDSVVSVSVSVFKTMRNKCSISLKGFTEKLSTMLSESLTVRPDNSAKPAETQAKVKSKRTSTKEYTDKSKPSQETFWGLLVGYDVVDDGSKSKKFIIIKVSDKSIMYFSNRLKRGKMYIKDFYKAAEAGGSGAVVPVLCYNWHEDYSDSYCAVDFYVKEDHPEFEAVSGLKISDMKIIVDEYINSL